MTLNTALKVGLLMVGLLCLSLPAMAQDTRLKVGQGEIIDSASAANTYFKLYEDYLMISPYLGLSELELDFRPANGDREQSVKYTSNNNYRVGLGLSYNDLAIFVGVGTSMTSYSTDIAPTSYSQDLTLSLINGGYFTRVSYREYAGLVETNELKDALANGKPLAFRDEMSFRQYHFKTGYFFNKRKFDYNTIVNSAGQHLKSASSFNLEGGFDHHYLTTAYSWVPPAKRDLYESSIEDARGYKVNSFVLSPGWAGIWAGKHWFVMGKFNLGIRANIIEAIYTNGRYQVMTFDPDASARICIGYNSPRWYVTLDTEGQSFFTSTKDFVAYTSYTQVYYTVGMRFWSPKLGRLMRKIPILKSFV